MLQGQFSTSFALWQSLICSFERCELTFPAECGYTLCGLLPGWALVQRVLWGLLKVRKMIQLKAWMYSVRPVVWLNIFPERGGQPECPGSEGRGRYSGLRLCAEY